MQTPEEKKFHLLCSYKDAGRPVSDDELRDAFDDAVSEAAYFEPEVGDDGNVDQLAYLEDLDDAESQVATWFLNEVSREIESILVCHEEA